MAMACHGVNLSGAEVLEDFLRKRDEVEHPAPELISMRCCKTTWPGGAGSPRPVHREALQRNLRRSACQGHCERSRPPRS